MEDYLTVKELSNIIKFNKQSIYNLIHKGTFVLGKHYLKPTPKKILFKWSEILVWMGDSSPEHSVDSVNTSTPSDSTSSKSRNRINI